ncbi:MAG TPA: aminotransferase class IV, partial [Gemmatimonadaceae bacterium]|nr:aminotransferase class IV [Gemmatimonadaceae bacterium]
APGGLAPPARPPRPTVVVAVSPPPAIPASVYAHGLTACVPTGRRNERAMTAGLKTLAYTDSVLALAEARAAGSDEALLLDTEGHLSEASASNVFLCAGGRLETPPCSCGALPGITRAAVFDCAAALGVACVEREITFAELCAADEAFLTSSLREIAPLVKVDDRTIGDGTPGPLTRRVMAAYREMVRRECGGS